MKNYLRATIANLPSVLLLLWLGYQSQQGKQLSDHVDLVSLLLIIVLGLSFMLYYALGFVRPFRRTS